MLFNNIQVHSSRVLKQIHRYWSMKSDILTIKPVFLNRGQHLPTIPLPSLRIPRGHIATSKETSSNNPPSLTPHPQGT